MNVDVSKLEVQELDAVVAKADGVDVFYSNIHDVHFLTERYDSGTDFQADAVYSPSTCWQDGGPIIERERIALVASDEGELGGPIVWCATVGPFGHYIDDSLPFNGKFVGEGLTPLIAAMRAYVASKDKAP